MFTFLHNFLQNLQILSFSGSDQVPNFVQPIRIFPAMLGHAPHINTQLPLSRRPVPVFFAVEAFKTFHN